MNESERNILCVIVIALMIGGPILLVMTNVDSRMIGIMLFVIVIIAIVIVAYTMVDRNREVEEHFMNEGRPYLDSKLDVCTISGKNCPVTNPLFTCADCRIASSPRVEITEQQSSVIDRCTYCGANFTKEQIKDGTITCEYCGKVHIIN